MAKATKGKKPAKPRQPKYDPKVTFEGTFDDMVNISLAGAGAKKKENKLDLKHKVGDKVILTNAELGDTNNIYTIEATRESRGVLFLPKSGFDYLIRDSVNKNIVMAYEKDIYK